MEGRGICTNEGPCGTSAFRKAEAGGCGGGGGNDCENEEMTQGF